MAVVMNPDSALSHELEKWNVTRPYQPFPRMVYQAHARENGKVECGDPGVAVGEAGAEAFTRRCQLTVATEHDLQRAREAGWSLTPQDAIAHHEARQRAIADAAAEVHSAVTKMSPKAQLDHKRRDAATDKHLPE